MDKPNIFTLERKDWQVIVTMLLAFVLVLFAHFFALNAVDEYEESSYIVKETYEAADLLRNLDHHLVEVESAVRGFIMLEDKKYASETEQGIKKVKADMVAVRKFFEDSSKEQQLVKLEELVDEKIRFNKNVMDSYRKDGKTAAAQMFSDSDAGQLRDSISALTDSLRQHHRQHLDEYIAQKSKTSDWLRSASWFSVLAVFLITSFSIFYLVKTARRRYQAEQEKAQKHQELLQALEAARQSSLLKEQFVANMSHEIRTPLNAILGFSSLLQRTELKEKQKEFTRSIQTSSENLLAIINDILDFSKIEAGAIRIEHIPFSLPSLLHSVDNMFRYRADEKGLRFEVQADEILPEAVQGDPTRLTQILVNLLGNAFKFTSNGSVKLHVGEAKRENGHITVRFTVSDTGIGIPTDKQAAIFERFGQATTDTTRRFGGAGLGLTISKQLIELQGGQIRVESDEGKGAAFIVEIPYEIAEAMTGNGKNKLQHGSFKNKKVSILVVEDNPMNSRIVGLLLDDWGFRYDHAENGKIALDKLNRQAYDLVLMDIQMPEMDGYTAAQHIRQELHLDVPIIATTAHAFAGEREKCIGYGMNDYISKPIKENELISLISRHVRQDKQKHPNQKAANATPGDPDGFDRQYILDIAKGKPEVLKEMAGLFISQSAKELAQIEKALQVNNFGEAATAAHSMKSTAAYMGLAASLGEVLKQLELGARSETPDLKSLRILLEKVAKTRNDAIVFLEKAFLK
ncbi:MAG: response regulator [Lewinellaceae bacterium]|nr:response regulator [Saprospiraceae bacterium]MCB0522768.1 response regulator [Saprospiraceae bacterium]MCB9341903.1 response regulator [Lewinellaceae bacterium]